MPMKKQELQFLRNLHMLRTLVSEVVEDDWVERANVGGMTFVQMNLLKFIGHARPVGASKKQNYWAIGDVAHQLSVTFAAASKAVARLVKEGLVESIENPADRRARQVRATRKGKRMLAHFAAVSEERGMALCEAAGTAAIKRWNNTISEILTALVEHDEDGTVVCLKCGVYDQSPCVAETFGAVCQLREGLEDETD